MSQPSKSAPLRGLFIGAGFFSRNHLHAWAEVEGAEIAAICDRDPARAEAAAKEFGIAEWVTDAAVLQSGRFDFVDICTTMETHEALVGLAVGAGVPVIVQKPFAPDIATCLRIEAAARRANEGEIEDVAPRLVKVVEADKDAAVGIFLGGYIE